MKNIMENGVKLLNIYQEEVSHNVDKDGEEPNLLFQKGNNGQLKKIRKYQNQYKSMVKIGKLQLHVNINSTIVIQTLTVSFPSK